jgi:hypothetical protein
MYVRLVTGTGEPTSGGNGLEGGAGTVQDNFVDADGDGYPDDVPDDSTVCVSNLLFYHQYNLLHIQFVACSEGYSYTNSDGELVCGLFCE